MKKYIILVGPPSSGKTLVAVFIKNLLAGVQVIYASRIIKKEVSGNKRVQEIIASGALVDDDLVIDVISKNFSKEMDVVLFDGYPRTIKQLNSLLDDDRDVYTIFFDISSFETRFNDFFRVECVNCFATHIKYIFFRCYKCGGKLMKRKEDRQILRRLAEYRKQTLPVCLSLLNRDKQKVLRISTFFNPLNYLRIYYFIKKIKGER